ncbi:MAG: pre-peptidase C-terminal domain-containing protein [Gammaproteobacteria bacterium]
MKFVTPKTALAIGLACLATSSNAFVVNNWWIDGTNIVMDDVMLPEATWSTPTQSQMVEWNQVDTTDNSHAFRINTNPQFSFGANDGDNTIGFLGEASLTSEYGLDYSNALAWAISWSSNGRRDESDVVLDPALSWSLNPNNSTWFQSTVLHELGHVRGLGHYNARPSMQNSGQSKYLRDEDLYRDDKEGVRQNASHVTERDITIQNKWHDGTRPQWMTMSPTTLREGDTISLNNIYVENRGTLSFTSNLRFGVYLSTNDIISTGDQLLNTGSWSTFSTWSTFNWSATIPQVNDCGTRWIGGIIDDNGAWSERFEGNNSVAFTNGVAFTGSAYTPTPLTIRLAEDAYEGNDTRGTAAAIPIPFFSSNLSIDQDFENDYYRITLNRTLTIDIDALFTGSLGNVNLQLLNSSGSVLASSSSTTSNESITRTLNAGTYYVRVYGSGTGSCNNYTLDIDYDRTAPTPNPMSFSSAPAEVNNSQVRMTSTLASDPIGPVNYYFDYTSSPTAGPGGTDSGWQTSRTYTDLGLSPNESYCYRVRARDGNGNLTNYSAIDCDYTAANPATLVSYSGITQTSMKVNVSLNGNPAGTEVWVRNATAGVGSGWSTNLTWQATGLECGTTYAFETFTRNGDGAFDSAFSIGSQATAACPGNDTDGDGVFDNADNCTLIANPSQTDSNGDGYGNRCDADLNNDCVVNTVDLGILRSVFFSNDADADLTGDGTVNVADLGVLRTQFFGSPGPSASGACP